MSAASQGRVDAGVAGEAQPEAEVHVIVVGFELGPQAPRRLVGRAAKDRRPRAGREDVSSLPFERIGLAFPALEGVAHDRVGVACAVEDFRPVVAHEAGGHAPHSGIVEGPHRVLEPVGIGRRVVVDEGDELSARSRHPGRGGPRVAEIAVEPQRPQGREALRRKACAHECFVVFRRRVVHDQDLVERPGLRQERLQTLPEHRTPVVGGDDGRKPHRGAPARGGSSRPAACPQAHNRRPREVRGSARRKARRGTSGCPKAVTTRRSR